RIAHSFYLPELAEVTTPEVCGVFAPEEFPTHFMVQTYHVRLDELRIRLQQRNRVRRNELQVRNQQLFVDVAQVPIHRVFKIRMRHSIHDLFRSHETTTRDYDKS